MNQFGNGHPVKVKVRTPVFLKYGTISPPKIDALRPIYRVIIDPKELKVNYCI